MVAAAVLGAAAGLTTGLESSAASARVSTARDNPQDLTATPARAGDRGDETGELPYTFISMPDFLNQDVGDLSVLPTYRVGDPNTTNAKFETNIDRVLTDVKSQNPAQVLVPGDQVYGHWGLDPHRSGLFGRVETFAQRRAAVRRAADLYYGQWFDRFERFDLDVVASIGDHEIGDDPWGPVMSDKHALVPTFKRAWAEHFTRTTGAPRFADHPRGPAKGTAYATMLNPDILLVTVDVFSQEPDDVVTRLDDKQATWLDATLRQARDRGVTWIVVQGHVPALGPVRARASSNLYMQGGRASSLWQIMAKHKVNLYLAGETHNSTAITKDGIVQVVTGGLFFMGETAYATISVTGDRMSLEVREFNATYNATKSMWALDHRNGSSRVSYPTASHPTGALVMTANHRVVSRSGKLAPYAPATR